LTPVYRLTRPAFAPGLDGAGAKRVGGRWNSPGKAVVYCASSASLAVLESFVHLPAKMRSPEKLPEMALVTLLLPEGCSQERVERSSLKPEMTLADYRAIGDGWIEAQSSLCLSVPSIIMPADKNFLLNPAHDEMSGVKVIGMEPFQYDLRMAKPE
jgi:RES domain-containing protein